MYHDNRNVNGPGRLADLMAELLKRFRHFSGAPEVAAGLATHLARIRVSARLLLVPGQAPGPASEGYVRLAGVLGELVARYESIPESLPAYLGRPLGRLADFLEEVLVRLDDGVPTGVVAADEGWDAVLASFRNAGTPLEVLEDVDDLFRKWGNRWSDGNLTPVQETKLRQRWLDLRRKGDRYFLADETGCPDLTDPPGIIAEGPLVFLLLDSSFRREQIREKLAGCGYRVRVLRDSAEVLEHLRTGEAPRAILCDNLEPTRHLVRLGGGMSELPPEQVPPLVLVVGSSLVGVADDRRALGLGAVAAWGDPFEPGDLRRILQRLSQP